MPSRTQATKLIQAVARSEQRARREAEARDRVEARANAQQARAAILTLLREERKRAKPPKKYKAFHKDVAGQPSSRPTLGDDASDVPSEFAGKVQPVLNKNGLTNVAATAARQRAADIRAYRQAQAQAAARLQAEEDAAQERIVQQDANKRLAQLNGALVAIDRKATAANAPKQTPLGRMAPAIAFDALVRLGNRTSAKVGAQPTPGRIGALIGILLLLQMFIMQVGQNGETRAQLFWLVITGHATIPLNRVESPTEATMMAAGQAAEQFVMSAAAASGSAIFNGATGGLGSDVQAVLGEAANVLFPHLP